MQHDSLTRFFQRITIITLHCGFARKDYRLQPRVYNEHGHLYSALQDPNEVAAMAALHKLFDQIGQCWTTLEPSMFD